jgi:hypothetical protein
MSSSKEYALIEIKFSADRLPQFSNQTSPWVEGHSNITRFDFDNHSEAYTVELALILVDKTDETFLLIGNTDHVDQFGSIAKFLNRITRKYKDKITIVYLSEESRLAPFYKVLRAEKCGSFSEAKGLFDTWIKALESDPHLPGKETDL